jgi:hypothetical protein
MKFGVYNAILHDRSLPEAIEVIAKLGSPASSSTPPSTTSSAPTPRETTSSDSSRAQAWRSQA